MLYKIQQSGITKHAITWRGALVAASSMPEPGPVRIERGGNFVAEVKGTPAVIDCKVEPGENSCGVFCETPDESPMISGNDCIDSHFYIDSQIGMQLEVTKLSSPISDYPEATEVKLLGGKWI
jgi:hypothetical protein